jgi:hypothetical protein
MRGSNGNVAGKHLRHGLRGDGVARRLGYVVGGLVFGLMLASMVSTAVNAHGRTNDGHHDWARIVGGSRAANPVAHRVVPDAEPRQSAQSTVAPGRTLSVGTILIEIDKSMAVVTPSALAADDVAVSRADHAGGTKVGIAPGVALAAAVTWSWGMHQTIIFVRSDWPVGCCADGRGCCCQGGSTCGSCGMTCCSSALAVVCGLDVTSDLGGRLNSLGAVNRDGINFGPADRPPAVRS